MKLYLVMLTIRIHLKKLSLRFHTSKVTIFNQDQYQNEENLHSRLELAERVALAFGLELGGDESDFE
jgi:hypothetical protein